MNAQRVEEDPPFVTKAGVAHNCGAEQTATSKRSAALNLAELLANEPLRQQEFPVARESVFLAHAGVFPLPSRVAAAMSNYAHQSTTGDQEEFVYPMILTNGRTLAAKLLNCQPEEVAVVGPT